MKIINYFLFLFIISALIYTSCKKEGKNGGPAITVTSPAGTASYTAGDQMVSGDRCKRATEEYLSI